MSANNTVNLYKSIRRTKFESEISEFFIKNKPINSPKEKIKDIEILE